MSIDGYHNLYGMKTVKNHDTEFLSFYQLKNVIIFFVNFTVNLVFPCFIFYHPCQSFPNNKEIIVFKCRYHKCYLL